MPICIRVLSVLAGVFENKKGRYHVLARNVTKAVKSAGLSYILVD